MKTPGQRGTFGDWLTRARTQRFATQAEALREYERLAGLRITPSQYAQWESGSRTPRADNPKVARLYDFYGSRPEDGAAAEANGTGDYAELVAATRQQTAAIERQTEVMAELLRALAGQPTGVPPSVQQEVAEAEADLEVALGSGKQLRPNVRREP